MASEPEGTARASDVATARTATNVVTVLLAAQFVGTAIYLSTEEHTGLDGLFLYHGVFWGFVFVSYAYWLMRYPERRTPMLEVLAGLYIVAAVGGMVAIFVYWLLVDGVVYGGDFISLLAVAATSAAVVFATLRLRNMAAVPSSVNTPAPGWHTDPTARHEERFFDGQRWTSQVRDGTVMTEDLLE